MTDETGENTILWLKSLLNGIFAWILGFIIYMIPGLIIATKMGFKLGPISNDPSALGQQIGQTISGIYQNSHWLTIGFIVVTALLIFWRARKLSKSTGDRGPFNGLLVAVFPVLIISLFIYSSGFDVTSVVEILGFLAAGYAGGYVSR